MSEREEIILELKKEFEKTKKELGLNLSFEELEETFALKDAALSLGFVSYDYSRQLCSRIIDYFRSWHDYLNNLLIPSSSYYASQTESKLFKSEKDRKEIWELINIIMALTSSYYLIGLSNDKVIQKEFIENGFKSWNDSFKPSLVKLFKKINSAWKKE